MRALLSHVELTLSVVDHWARMPGAVLLTLVALILGVLAVVHAWRRSPKLSEAPWLGLPIGVLACVLAAWEMRSNVLLFLALAGCALNLSAIGAYAARGELRQRFRQWLGTRRAFGRTLTDESRADPDLLPEDEFPVWCSKCGYELRGLAQPRCPECGSEFDRGRLLVDQYVWKRGLKPTRLRRLAGWVGWLSLGFSLMPTVVILVGSWLLYMFSSGGPPSWTRSAWFDRIPYWIMSAYAVAMIVAFVAVVLYCLAYRGMRKRGREVVATIPENVGAAETTEVP